MRLTATGGVQDWEFARLLKLRGEGGRKSLDGIQVAHVKLLDVDRNAIFGLQIRLQLLQALLAAGRYDERHTGLG